jgi:alpha-glucosidase
MHTEGYTCYDPLFFHFPTLDEVFNNVEHTFIVGDALKVSPVLEAGAQTIKSYFPNGRWVSMKDYSDVVVVNDPSGGKYVDLKAPEDTVNVHLMPGKIAIYQDNTKQDKMLTDDMLKVQSVSLIVNRDTNKHADGRVFLDDGISLSSI